MVEAEAPSTAYALTKSLVAALVLCPHPLELNETTELPPELEAPGPVEAGLPAKLISGVPELPAELGDSTPRDPELLPEL